MHIRPDNVFSQRKPEFAEDMNTVLMQSRLQSHRQGDQGVVDIRTATSGENPYSSVIEKIPFGDKQKPTFTMQNLTKGEYVPYFKDKRRLDEKQLVAMDRYVKAKQNRMVRVEQTHRTEINTGDHRTLH